MIKDFGTYRDSKHIFEADICIVGAGVAGISLAREFLGTKHKVILLESGGTDFEKETQDLMKGEVSGKEYYDLDHSRLRFFGGTTAIWGGRCAQLDSIDFEKRPWVDHSGWPVNKVDIAPYYKRAQKHLELDQVNDNEYPGPEVYFNGTNIKPAFWQFDQKFDRFTIGNCRDLIEAENITVLLHANLTDIIPTENGKSISELTIQNLAKAIGTVKAKDYVIAAGGLETPRLLLNAKHKSHPSGIGNNNDLVGRFFMEHPHGRAAEIKTENPKELLSIFPSYLNFKGKRYGLLGRPSDEFQKQSQSLNTSFTVSIKRHPGQQTELYRRVYNDMRHSFSPNKNGRRLWKLVKNGSKWVQGKILERLDPQILLNEKKGIYAVIRAEQAPNPDSRVRLSSEKDIFGQNIIDLDWKFSAIDKHSIHQTMKGFDTDLKDLNLGTVVPENWLSDDNTDWEFDSLVSNHNIGGYHHIGTTRMSDSDKTGVVDASCRIHGIENLYVSGSSVFPTGGWANPTLTIMALSIRLADHLKRV